MCWNIPTLVVVSISVIGDPAALAEVERVLLLSCSDVIAERRQALQHDLFVAPEKYERVLAALVCSDDCVSMSVKVRAVALLKGDRCNAELAHGAVMSVLARHIGQQREALSAAKEDLILAAVTTLAKKTPEHAPEIVIDLIRNDTVDRRFRTSAEHWFGQLIDLVGDTGHGNDASTLSRAVKKLLRADKLLRPAQEAKVLAHLDRAVAKIKRKSFDLDTKSTP